MANIAGVSFGTNCDHMVRRFVVLHYDPAIGFYIDVPATIDVTDPELILFVNDEAFVAVGVVSPDSPNRVVFASLGGFGFGGFGSGGFGAGGFNVGINIADLGLYPVDDVELQFKTVPKFCPKCLLYADNGSVLIPVGGA